MEAEKRGKVNCVGEPRGRIRVYLEEACAAFLKENSETALGGFQMFGLLGKEYRLGEEMIFLIRGVLERSGGHAQQMQISLETIRAMEAEKERQFPSLRLIGWAVNQPGYGTEGAWRFAGLGEQYFSDAPLFLLIDGREGQMVFYHWQGKDYEDLGGYHIYSDEDEFVQPRSMSERIQKEDTEEKAQPLWELPEEETEYKKPVYKRTEQIPVRQSQKEEEPKENTQSMRMLTSLASVLLLVCLVMGMLLFNNINTLDGIQSKLDNLDQQLEQIHTGMFGTGQ